MSAGPTPRPARTQCLPLAAGVKPKARSALRLASPLRLSRKCSCAHAQSHSLASRNRSTSATAEYEIAGRKLKFMSVPELLTARDRYRIDVAREDAALRSAAGLSNPGRIYVRHV